METKALNKKIFSEILKEINQKKDDIDLDFLYELYEVVIDGINTIFQTVPNYKFVPVNHVSVILYIINEYNFNFNGKSKDKIDECKKNQVFFNAFASICCDKYLTNEQLNYKTKSILNKFNPEISTLSLYLNYILNTLEKIEVKDKISELVKRLLNQSFKLSKCILELLLSGSETEAFSTWRTLHETECILVVLISNGKELFDSYFKHITYALAYRHQISEKEADRIFVDIKKEMKENELKSKDMKKFIEYGFLYALKNYKEDGLQLNFRDGVEKAAKLDKYNKIYELSSEVAHSSPMLLLSDKNYYLSIVMLNLYETFFRLENIYNACFKGFASKTDYENYLRLRNLYLSQLQIIYDTIRNKQ